ncbi:MAG: hypothetical protein HYZ58_19615 [Acidobacteria bacterium]|nr:hypothetical protein [Acidobacteriota bacterium]
MQYAFSLAQEADAELTILHVLIMMVVGLGLGVTMIMLPVGIIIGLIGVAIFVSGLFAHFNEKTRAWNSLMQNNRA